MNPVVFGTLEQELGFTAYCRDLSEFDWEGHLVGVTANGFLFVDDRVARIGYYEFFPKLLPWDDVDYVRIARYIALLPSIAGLAALIGGLLAGINLLRGNIEVDGKPLKFVVIACLGGFIFAFGAHRHRIQVLAKGAKMSWTSKPLMFRKTIEICQATTDYCVENGVEHFSSYSYSADEPS